MVNLMILCPITEAAAEGTFISYSNTIDINCQKQKGAI